MFTNRLICAFSLIFVTLLATTHSQLLSERNGIINGTLLSSTRNFPHHVGIRMSSTGAICGASIIHPKWLLTTQTCVETKSVKEDITVLFNQLNQSANSIVEYNSYSMKIPKSQVHYLISDNLALLELPVPIVFNSQIAPVGLLLDRAPNLDNKYAVMPGPKQNTTLLAYGEFEIQKSSTCKSTYPWYNHEKEVCTLGWKSKITVPCSGAHGGGLLIDWPTAPRLVGVFSAPQSCLSNVASEYVRIAPYVEWIENTMNKRVRNGGFF